MSWHYRDPMTFPAAWHNAIREAAKSDQQPVLLERVFTREQAKSLQYRFRWFKWCCSHESSAASDIRAILESFSIRCTFEVSSPYLLLYITAKPKFLIDFPRLNPTLAKEILPNVNE